MIRSTCLVLLVCGGLVLSACKKGDDGTGTTGTPAATATATATASAAPAETATAAPAAPTTSASAAPADSAAPATTTTPNAVAQRPIDDCCSSLASLQRGARGRGTRDKSFRAMEICPGIADLVRSGRATRAQALTQIRSALVGYPVPSTCR